MTDTPRARFVEAMRAIVNAYGGIETQRCETLARQAVEAFADAECNADYGNDVDLHKPHHAACRAALLRECGLED